MVESQEELSQKKLRRPPVVEDGDAFDDHQV
jgi:hypothetical protein